MKILSILGFALMVAGIAAFIITRTIVSPFVPAIVLQVLAFALMLWARKTFGRRSLHAAADPTAGGLVTTGPYRFVRHPIYTAVCLFTWASVLGTPSVRAAAFATVVTVGALARMLCEEQLLVEQYPDYAAYSSRTKRMIPFVF